ncbi:MAG: hypothetical protein RR929_02635 [Erysipelotrichaceae bacterium]
MQEEINNLAQALLYFSDVFIKNRNILAIQLLRVYDCLKQYIETNTISKEDLLFLKQLNLSLIYSINDDDTINIQYHDFGTLSD